MLPHGMSQSILKYLQLDRIQAKSDKYLRRPVTVAVSA